MLTRHEGVIRPRQPYAQAARTQPRSRRQGHIQDDILLLLPVNANGAGVLASVTGIDHNQPPANRRRRPGRLIGRPGRGLGRPERFGDVLSQRLGHEEHAVDRADAPGWTDLAAVDIRPPAGVGVDVDHVGPVAKHGG